MNATVVGQLRAAGMKVTAGRLAVLDAVEKAPHSGASALHALVRDDYPSLSVQAVHNVLSDLAGAGLLRKIEPAGSAALYERRAGDNHHHAVCISCAAVEDIDCIHGEAPCLSPSDAKGFRIDSAEVVFWGLCPDCAGHPSDLTHPPTNEETP